MDLVTLLSVFMVIFAVIDTLGALPVLVDLQNSGKKIQALRTTLIAAVILYAFFFGGEWILRIFSVDFHSFAVAGSIVLFFLSLEMILDTSFFKGNSTGDATVVPIAFPLIAGPGSITTLISLRAEYDMSIIAVALAMNLVVVYIVIKTSTRLEKLLGSTVNYILKKFFGIILLAMAVRLFASNLKWLIS